MNVLWHKMSSCKSLLLCQDAVSFELFCYFSTFTPSQSDQIWRNFATWPKFIKTFLPLNK